MDLQLFHLAIHQMPTDFEIPTDALILSEELMERNEPARQLIMRLHRSFSLKNDVLQGRLASPEDALFPAYFHELVQAEFTDEAFLQFSRQGMETLERNAREETADEGTYWIFAHYAVGEQTFLGIFMVRDAEGLAIRKAASPSFELHPTTYLQLDQLSLACRIHLQRGLSPDQVIKAELTRHGRRQKELPEYFLNWVAMEDSASSRELTDTFLDAVAQLSSPLSEETGEPIESGAFREQVAQFASQNPSHTINIKAFDENFYGEEESPLQNFLQDNNIELQEEFRFDRQALRDYHFHRLKTNGMYFGCKHSFLLSGKVRVEGGQLIIDDEDLAEQISEILRG